MGNPLIKIQHVKVFPRWKYLNCHRQLKRTIKMKHFPNFLFAYRHHSMAPPCAEWLWHSYHHGHFLSEETKAAEPFQKTPQKLAETERKHLI